MRFYRIESGITLVALIITIVVIIILATVTINMVFGENGLITEAERAKNLYEQGAINEAESMNQVLSEIDKITGKELYEEEIEKFKQAETNLNDAMALVETATEATFEMQEKLQEIYLKTNQIIYGTNTSENILNMSQEINSLLNEIENIAQNTTFNGIKIVNGSLVEDNAYKIDIITRELILEIDGITRQDLGLEQVGDLTIEEEANEFLQAVKQAIEIVRFSLGKEEAKYSLYHYLEEYYSSANEILSQNLSEDDTKDELAKNGMNNIISALELLNRLETQVAENSYTPEDIESISIQINEIINEINIIAEDLEFKGQKLLNGTYKDIPNLNSKGLSQNGEEFYINLDTEENINKSITECENAITKIEEILKKF